MYHIFNLDYYNVLKYIIFIMNLIEILLFFKEHNKNFKKLILLFFKSNKGLKKRVKCKLWEISQPPKEREKGISHMLVTQETYYFIME